MTRSAEYWKRRAEANMDGVQRGAEQRLARLGRAYHQAARELEGEVQRILGTYAKRFDLTPEEAAAALREPADEESRAYGYRVSRAEALEKAIRERLNGLGARLERETAAQREWTASKSYQSARKMMRDMTGGVVSQAVPDLQGLLRAMDTAWSGRNYSARIWRNTDHLAQMLEDEIEAAFLSGKSVRRMANVIMDRFGVGYRAAECLMRTETSYVQNQTAAQSYRDAGCTEYEILTASDRRTCRRCAAQNGRRYLFTEMQAGENAPPFHPNCRCTILPVVGEEERLAKKAGPEELGFAVAKAGESGIIKAESIIPNGLSNELHPVHVLTREEMDGALAESDSVHYVGKIDLEIYKCVTKDIITDEVIMTDERIRHIKDHHPNDFERYQSYIALMLCEPDYILENEPNTALVLKEFLEGEEKFRLVLRLETSCDNPEYKNSVITFMKTNSKKWRQNLNNKKILYSRK